MEAPLSGLFPELEEDGPRTCSSARGRRKPERAARGAPAAARRRARGRGAAQHVRGRAARRGRPASFIVQVVDMTERAARRQAEALADTVRKLQTVADAALSHLAVDDLLRSSWRRSAPSSTPTARRSHCARATRGRSCRPRRVGMPAPPSSPGRRPSCSSAPHADGDLIEVEPPRRPRRSPPRTRGCSSSLPTARPWRSSTPPLRARAERGRDAPAQPAARAACRGYPASSSPPATCRAGRSAATGTTRSRWRAGASAWRWATWSARA